LVLLQVITSVAKRATSKAVENLIEKCNKNCNVFSLKEICR